MTKPSTIRQGESIAEPRRSSTVGILIRSKRFTLGVFVFACAAGAFSATNFFAADPIIKTPTGSVAPAEKPAESLAALPEKSSGASPAAKPADKERPPYAAMGSPIRPKVAVQWNRFHDYAESTKLLQDLQKAYPELCKLQSLGLSYGKHEMWVFTITNSQKGREEQKAGFWIDGGIHANEIQASEVPLYTAWYLLEMYAQNETVRRLVDDREFYIMPMMSPDAREAHFYEPNTTHSPRTGLRPVDEDKDGLVDEDGPDDLDGDGHITQMRIRDPNGKWRAHPDFPELMVRVKEGEKGEYTMLGWEGIDNDGDGKINEDGPGGYDPNRNWPWYWQPEYVQNGAHRYPLSILENRMVADFQMAHRNLAGGQSYHNAGGMILRGPGTKTDAYDPADVQVYNSIGKRGEEMLPGYKYINVANDLYEVYGGEIDFLHQVLGVFTFTNELFSPFNYFGRSSEHGWFGSDETQRTFDKYMLLGDGVVPWHEFDHPQYGKIEIGGLKKNWTRQPPAFLLEEECHRNMAFTLYHAEQMPAVKVQGIDLKPLGDGITQVTAIIENSKLIPTHSAADLKHKLTPPDLVTVSGKDVKVLVGWFDNDQFFLSPTEQKRDPARIKVANLPGHGVIYVRWLVQGAGPYTIDVVSTKGGTDRRTTGESDKK